MAILWIDGFEGYGSSIGGNYTSRFLRRYVPTTGTFYVQAGRTGGYSASSNSTGNYLQTPPLTSDGTLIIGIAVYRPSSVSSNISIVQLYDGWSTLGIDVKWMYSTGEIAVYRGTTLLGTTTGAGLQVGAWTYVEVKVKCHDTLGTVEVRTGGSPRLSLTDQDTKAGTGTCHNIVRLYLNQYQYIDDVYICDSTGSANNDLLGNRKVVGLFPATDTATLQWTPSTGVDHYALVDEIAPPTGDSDWVETDVPGSVDLFNYQDIYNVGSISAIQVNTTCRTTDAESFSLITEVVSGETTSDDAGQPIPDPMLELSRILEVDPATGSPWTMAGLNNAKIGVKV